MAPVASTVAVTGLASGSAFNARGEDFSDRDNAGRETRTIEDDAGRTAETIQNYAVDDSGQPVDEADENLVSATTYHVTQQIASTGTLSPYAGDSIGVAGDSATTFSFVFETDPITGDLLTPPLQGSMFVMYDASTGGFVLTKYDNSGWGKWDGSEWTPITATASDVLVAIAGVSKTDVTVTSLAASASFFEGVQCGYRSGDISFETSPPTTSSAGGRTYEDYSFTITCSEFTPYYLAQTTLDLYGSQIGVSSPNIFSNDLLRAVIYADSSATWDDVEGGTGGDFVEYTYDRQGETTSMENQDLVLHDYTHDGLGHETSDTVSLPYGNPANIDTTVTELAFAYKVCGRFLSATSLDANGNVVNQVLDDYDANGDLDKIYQEHGGPVDTSTSEYVAYGYDSTTSSVDDPALGGYVTVADTAFRPTTLQYPTTGTNNSRVITDSYGTSGEMNDEINQLDSIIDGTGTADDATTGDTIDTVAHLGDGTLTAETYDQPNIGYNLLGTTTISGVATPNLDQFNRVQNMFWKNYAGTTLDGFEYLRNAQGDVTQRINAVDAVFSEMYVNDKLDQVQSLTRGTITDSSIADPTFTEDFSPNGFGNQTKVTTDGVEQDQNFTSTNELLNYNDSSGSSTSDWAAPTYDAAGNSTVTPDPLDPTTGLNIQVDGWNHVTQVSYSDSIGVSYSYDALGNMIVRVNNLTATDKVSTTDIYYSGQQVVEEDPRLPASPDGAATAVAHQYVYSPRSINTPILDTQTSYTVVSGDWSGATASYYFLTDANNNVTAVTNASGAVQEHYVYSAFGAVTIESSDYSATLSASSVNNTVLFACMSIDTDTGLYKDGGRIYSSLTSAFMTPDPAQSDFNTYRYCLNDPTNGTDPTGLWGEGVGQSFVAPSNPCSGSPASAQTLSYSSANSSTFNSPPPPRVLLLPPGWENNPRFQALAQQGKARMERDAAIAAPRQGPAWEAPLQPGTWQYEKQLDLMAEDIVQRHTWAGVGNPNLAWAQRRYDANQMANMNIVEQLLYITFRPTGYDPVFGPQSNFTMATAIAGPAAAAGAMRGGPTCGPGPVTVSVAPSRVTMKPNEIRFAVVSKEGKLLAETTDTSLSHAEFVKRTLGELPEGAQVVTFGKNGFGEFGVFNSRTFHNNQLPAPVWVWDALGGHFQ